MNLFLIGDGSHAKVVDNQLKILGFPTVSFVSEALEEAFLIDLKSAEGIFDKSAKFHVGIGHNETRKEVTARFRKFLQIAEPIISQSAYVEGSAQIGDGSFVAPFSYCGINSLVGSGCILNTGSKIDHDVKIGDFSHLGGNSYVAGGVEIGDQVFIGAGCTVIDGIKIASNIIIGAGAVVINDITEPGLYVGTPAKLKR
jgi:sugar O-acyltransferase (sialic acid O-acetyltransferase NeuD family)